VVTTLRIRTRLRVSAADRAVIVALGTHLGRLARADLATRSRAGLDHNEKGWAERKRAITKESSSRWAGAITKASNDAYATARRNQLRQQADLARAIATLEAKVALPCHSAQERRDLHASRAGRKLSFGYRSSPELAMKRARLQPLRGRKANLDREVEAGRVHITRGGKSLLRHRLHLDRRGSPRSSGGRYGMPPGGGSPPTASPRRALATRPSGSARKGSWRWTCPSRWPKWPT